MNINFNKSPLSETEVVHNNVASCFFINNFDKSVNKKVILQKKFYPRIEKYTLYLPENLDIDQILKENNSIFRFKRDKFVYILSLIYSIPAQKKDMIDNYSDFTPINKSILGMVIKDYRKYINYLKYFNIVEEDTQYETGKKSQGLRFSPKYRTLVKPVEITDWCLIKNIVYLRKNFNEKRTQEIDFLKKWFLDGNLNIDIEGAKAYLLEEYNKDIENKIPNADIRYNNRILPIIRLKENSQTPLFFVDTTAGRLHTNFTQLKSELRKYVTYNGQTLCNIDISNSQPFLLNSLLNIELYRNNRMKDRIINAHPNFKEKDFRKLERFINSISQKEDVIKFKELINSGQFYEEFGKILQSNKIINDNESNNLRSIAKQITMGTLFNKNYAIKYDNSIRIFKSLFPNVYKVIKQIKVNHHPTLAVILQNLEADLILNQTCRIISENHPEIPIFTLHDSIITTLEHKDTIKNIMIEVLHHKLHYPPNIKFEEWR